MSERRYIALLIGGTISVIVFLTLFQFVGHIHHIGIYEFLTQFDLLLQKFFFPFVIASIITICIRFLICEHYFIAKLVGRAPRPWLWALLYGMYSVLLPAQLIDRKNMFFRNGINIGTIWIYLLSNILLSLPLLLFIFLIQPDIFLLYCIIALGSILFLGALGELLQYQKILPAPPILVRNNPDVDQVLFFSFWKHLSYKEVLQQLGVHVIHILQYMYMPLLIGMILASLFSAAIDTSLQDIIFYNSLITFMTLMIISCVLPLFSLSAFVFGYSIFIMNGNISAFFILIVLGALWRIIFKKQLQQSESKMLLFILFSVIACVGGYVMWLFYTM